MKPTDFAFRWRCDLLWSRQMKVIWSGSSQQCLQPWLTWKNSAEKFARDFVTQDRWPSACLSGLTNEHDWLHKMRDRNIEKEKRDEERETEGVRERLRNREKEESQNGRKSTLWPDELVCRRKETSSWPVINIFSTKGTKQTSPTLTPWPKNVGNHSKAASNFAVV